MLALTGGLFLEASLSALFPFLLPPGEPGADKDVSVVLTKGLSSLLIGLATTLTTVWLPLDSFSGPRFRVEGGEEMGAWSSLRLVLE